MERNTNRYRESLQGKDKKTESIKEKMLIERQLEK
jgi:hypothetical protein